MAHIKEYRDKNGTLKSFYIRVHRGKGIKPYSTTFHVDSSWTEKRAWKEAERFALLYEEECKKGRISIESVSLSEYMDYMIELKNDRGQLKKRTYVLYTGLANKIKKGIGHIKLKDLSVKDLNNYYSSLNHLSAKSIHEYHGIINMALSQAVKEGLLVYNIADRVELPKITKKESNYFQKDDIKNILTAAESESLEHKVLINLFAFTGCRRGEIAGLKWSVVDFENNQIHICNNVLYSPMTGVYEDAPKTQNSDRYITLPDKLINLLREYKKCSRSQIYVFCDRSGEGPLHPDSISTYLKRFSEKHNLPHINSHAFRHSMASILYFEGMDVVSISARLGHSKVSTTANIYTHTMNKYDEKNAKLLENLLIVEK